MLHPIVGVERDADGAIEAVLHPREASRRESVMHFELDRRLTRRAARGARGGAAQACSPTSARRSRTSPRWPTGRGGWSSSRAPGAARYADEEVDETVAFLEWLLHDNFIFLGYREYRFRDGAISVVPDSGLGILSDDRAVDVREAGADRLAAARACASGRSRATC